MRTRASAYFRRLMLAAGVAVNVFALMATLFAGYAGHVDPDVMPFAGLAGMTFPLWLIFDALLLVADLIFKRRLALLPLLGFIGSAGPIMTFAPIHFGGGLTENEMARSFKVLNYNILHFEDIENQYPDGINRTLHYIIESDADIVCLQECDRIKPDPRNCVTPEQIDTIHQMYPHILIEGNDQAVLSKYPVEHIPLPRMAGDHGDMTAYRMTVDDHPLTVFNVHLQSIGLTLSDKELFMELTDEPNEQRLRRTRSQLISKLYEAYRQRASQGRRLRDLVRESGENVIVCGDFNDVPGCYAVRTIEEAGMRDAYAEAACGPAVTYSANRFYFRIDQVLYKGDMRAISVVRGDVRSSDHYPLLTTFVWNTDSINN